MINILTKNIIIFGSLIILYTLELIFPYFDSWKGKLKHSLRNAGLIIFNSLIINILLVPLIVLSANTSWGVFNQFELSWQLELVFTIILIDFLVYVLHVAYHKFPILWRFHKVHHSDTQMDVTTGARFHIGEHTFSILVRLLLFAGFAMKLEYIIIYETLFIVNVLFHHSNITLGEGIDKFYRIFLTSPNMHKVHHSNVQKETDSNYTSLLSIWDRIFKTFTIVKNTKKIVYGIKGLENEQGVVDMLKTPFKKG